MDEWGQEGMMTACARGKTINQESMWGLVHRA